MTIVNPQITDAASDAPISAPAVSTLYVELSQALSLAAHNAVNAQQQGYTTMLAATVEGIETLYAIDTAAAGEAVKNAHADAARQIDDASPPSAASSVRVPASSAPDDVAYAMRATGTAFAAALDAMSEATSRNLKRALALAAEAACLAAMIANPDKSEQYAAMLRAIRTLP
jgi:RES domain-containing protein